MSDSVCVLNGPLPILKAFKVHGSVWLQTSGKQTGSSKQCNIVCKLCTHSFYNSPKARGLGFSMLYILAFTFKY